jgi:hypothetical protein
MPGISKAFTAAGCIAMLAMFIGGVPSATGQDGNLQTDTECLQTHSRTKAGCEPQETVVNVESEVSVSIEAPVPKTRYCATTMELEYSQRDTLAHVEGQIDNNDCAASSGEYRLAIVIRGVGPEPRILEFVESWQRQDDQPVQFKGDYPIGENTDLIRVRSRQLRCTCAEIPAAGD